MLNAESVLKDFNENELPPVDKWNPEYCGELDLQIKADGSWFYEGTPIGRRKLQVLFSRIIKKENDQYFLITPVEKVAIQVDWMPFTLIDFEREDREGKTFFTFTDNCDNQVTLDSLEQLVMSNYQGQSLPTINVRRNLFASFSRSCYYRLLAEADIIEHHDQNQVQIISNGIPFSLGTYAED